jgi:hypothetical protein
MASEPQANGAEELNAPLFSIAADKEDCARVFDHLV